METFVIAEAGANHNRNFKQALKLIDVAKECGANACKFQTYTSKTLYSKNTPNFAGYENINNLISEIELPREWQKDLKSYCDDLDIEFMSTPFDEKAVEELYNLGVKRLKVAGFESTDLRFIKLVASTQLPLIISLGIGSDLNLIEKIKSICDDVNCTDLTFLHCNNAYPTPIEDINLTNIKLIKDLGYKVGLSDHTMDTLIPSLGVCMGASVIEKHFTLSRNLPGPDHPFALEPHQLKEMINKIKLTELSLGIKTKKFTPSENNFKKAMRSLVALKKIKKGEVLTQDNVTTKRPFLEGNIEAEYYFDFLGKEVKNDINEDEFVKKNNLR
tara:strand:+ start:4269 stop:5258 length:990 start_codon:yes stop_codon:yes gene_type:complete